MRLYDLPKGDMAQLIVERVRQFRDKEGHNPCLCLSHPSRLAEVQSVLPLARTRESNEPLPQPNLIILG